MRDGSKDHDPDDPFDRLYNRFAVSLYRYALMVLANPEEAADAVQQVFLGVLRKRNALELEERYLRRAVRNECYSALRRRRHDRHSVSENLLEAVAGQDERPDERLAAERALLTLPVEQREVVHLKIFEGLTFQEIADVVGESINTVGSRYRYAIDKLRAHLGERR